MRSSVQRDTLPTTKLCQAMKRFTLYHLCWRAFISDVPERISRYGVHLKACLMVFECPTIGRARAVLIFSLLKQVGSRHRLAPVWQKSFSAIKSSKSKGGLYIYPGFFGAKDWGQRIGIKVLDAKDR